MALARTQISPRWRETGSATSSSMQCRWQSLRTICARAAQRAQIVRHRPERASSMSAAATALAKRTGRQGRIAVREEPHKAARFRRH